MTTLVLQLPPIADERRQITQKIPGGVAAARELLDDEVFDVTPVSGDYSVLEPEIET